MLSKLLKPKKLHQITAGFQKTLNELDALQVRNFEQIERHQQAIDHAEKSVADLQVEKNNAGVIYANIQKLLSV